MDLNARICSHSETERTTSPLGWLEQYGRKEGMLVSRSERFSLRSQRFLRASGHSESRAF